MEEIVEEEELGDVWFQELTQLEIQLMFWEKFFPGVWSL
jgi:hypothetical protein